MFAKFLFRFVATLATVAILATAGQAVTIDYVPVGDPGNVADDEVMSDSTIGYGRVDYAYNIGTYEVTAGQYTEFLNAVAKTDTNGLYNTGMWSIDQGCKIERSGSSGSYTYSVDVKSENRPVNLVSFYDTLRFSNWLHNGQPTGAQGPSTTEDGAYDVSLGDSVVRKPGARVFLPSEDEWYKAAYYDADNSVYYDYPTGTDATPSNVLSNPASDPGNNANFDDGGPTIGSPYWMTEVGDFENSASPYGTFDQGGNLWELNEVDLFGGGSSRGMRGSGWDAGSGLLHASGRYGSPATLELASIGFRVASVVPEPGSITLLVCGMVSGLIWWRRRK